MILFIEFVYIILNFKDFLINFVILFFYLIFNLVVVCFLVFLYLNIFFL
jgi:hypothetical protein